MTHSNRGRLTVALGGAWRLYTNTLPANSRAIGTITGDGYDTGALVLIEATGLYVQVNAGAIRSLPQAKVAAALAEVRTGQGGPGRGQGLKAADGATGLKRTNITIDPESAETLRAVGDGDLSLGIRRAAVHLRSMRARGNDMNTIEKLEAAIAAATPSVGGWHLEANNDPEELAPDSYSLIWIAPRDEIPADWTDSYAIWDGQGGNAIIDSAGLTDTRSTTGSENFQDASGRPMLMEWVTWSASDIEASEA